MECLNCNKEVKQTHGKRAKKYCNPDCRQKHWLKKAKAGKPKGPGPGRPPKKRVIQVEEKADSGVVFPSTIEQMAQPQEDYSMAVSKIGSAIAKDTRKVINPDDPKTKQKKEPEEGTNAFFLKYGVFTKKDLK